MSFTSDVSEFIETLGLFYEYVDEDENCDKLANDLANQVDKLTEVVQEVNEDTDSLSDSDVYEDPLDHFPNGFTGTEVMEIDNLPTIHEVDKSSKCDCCCATVDLEGIALSVSLLQRDLEQLKQRLSDLEKIREESFHVNSCKNSWMHSTSHELSTPTLTFFITLPFVASILTHTISKRYFSS